MITIRRLADAVGQQFYSVESRLEDEKLQEQTRSVKFKCNTHGFEDDDARSKALRFVIATDCLRLFRAFIFSEGDVAPASAREAERRVPPSRAPFDSHVVDGPYAESFKRRIRSYVCMRQNRLTGLRFVVAMSRLESGRLRAVSFQDFTSAGRSMSDEALNMAMRFLHGVSFDSWRKEAINELTNRDREASGHRRERGLKHVSAFVEIEAGEKVDCACGRNRSRGLMVACERCEAWEHAECRGFRSDKQIPAQYICSACVKADGEDVVVIRLDEQGEFGNLKVEDLSTNARITDRETDAVCCVCGCEDNQYFESMISPQNGHACDDGMAVAHPSCISAVQHLAQKAWNGKAMAADWCQFCGDQFVKSVQENEAVDTHKGPQALQFLRLKGSLSPNNSQCRNLRLSQSSRGAKRMRSALNNGDIVSRKEGVDKRSTAMEKTDVHDIRGGESMELTTSESGKAFIQLPKVMHSDKRFGDAAVAVPIKKRRLNMKVVRSPSPPSPRLPCPSSQGDDNRFSKRDDALQNDVQRLMYKVAEVAKTVEVGCTDLVSAKLNVRCDDATNIAIAGMSKEEQDVDQKTSSLRGVFVDNNLVQGAGGSLRAFPCHANCCFTAVREGNLADSRTADLVSQRDLSGKECIHTGSVGRDGRDIRNAHDAQFGKGKQHEEDSRFVRTEEKIACQGRLPDVRLHWDLNMDIEEWERPPEEDTGTRSAVHEGVTQNIYPEKSDTSSHDCEGILGVGNEIGPFLHSHAEQVVGSLRPIHSGGDTSVNNLEEEAAGDTTSVAAGSGDTIRIVENEELNSAGKKWSLDEDFDVLEAEHVDYDGSDSDPGNPDGVSDVEEGNKLAWRENDGRGLSEQREGAHDCVSDEQAKIGHVDEVTIDREGPIIPSSDERSGVVMEGIGAGSSYRDRKTESVWVTSLAIQCAGFDPSVSQSNAKDRGLPKEIDLTEPGEGLLSQNSKRFWTREDVPAQDNRVSILRLSAAREDGQSRTVKSSGWDQLPPGFDKAEDALRAAKETFGVWNGRAPPRGSANGRDGSDSQGGGNIITRFGRGLFNDDVPDRVRSGEFWTKEDHRFRSADIRPRFASPQEQGRVKNRGRGVSPTVRSRGRMESWIDRPAGLTAPWDPSRHPSPQGIYPDGFGPDGPNNAAARALMKVESSGFIVAPDGTLSKAGSSTLGSSRAFSSRGHTGRGATCNMGRGSGMNTTVGMRRTGLPMNTSMGRSKGMSPGMSTNSGIPIGIGIAVGSGLSVRMPSRGPRDQEIVDRHSSLYGGHGSVGSPITRPLPSNRARGSEEKSCDRWARGENGSASPRKRIISMRSSSYSLSRSKSQTRSPKPKTPPRPAKSSGSDGNVLGRSNNQRSRSPANFQAEARCERPEPHTVQRLVHSPSLPSPPPALRGQLLTPLGGLHQLSDFRKDACRARHKDQQKERPETRPRSPPRRTSPHVVHGSALMDERDRLLLAEMRHISPARANNNSFEILRKVAGTPCKYESPMASISGRLVERAGCARRQPTGKCGELKVHVSKSEAEGCKSEQQCGKIFRIGKESSVRRDGRPDRCQDRRGCIKSYYSGREREGRSSCTNLKNNGEGDDDVAPRRKRPSP